MTPSRRRRAARIVAVVLMVGLPVAAFELTPSPRAHADDSPGSNLAGLNATATATGVQVSPLTPGIVGAGDVSQGNLIEMAAPFASAATTTGPSHQAVASPAYPGATAAGAGNALGTFAPQFPPALLSALNYQAQAQADYPPQVNTPSSDSFSPPGGASTGAGNAVANATPTGADALAVTNDTGFPGSVMSIGSSKTHSTTVLTSSSVTATAHSEVSSLTLLGQIVISGITGDAAVVSDGNSGTPSSDFKIGSVTVAGQPAYIGPDGIHLSGSPQGGLLVPTANSVLSALNQAGIAVRTVAPSTQSSGSSATVQSGALSVEFFDGNIPNPSGAVPVSAAGLDVYFGLSEAQAQATPLPSVDLSSLGSIGAPGPTGPTGDISTPPSAVTSPGASSALSTPPIPAAAASVAAGAPPLTSGAQAAAPGPSTPAPTGSSAGGPGPGLLPGIQPAASVMGVPVRTSAVIIAFLLSLVAAGPLLGYANWQLLRGRRS